MTDPATFDCITGLNHVLLSQSFFWQIRFDFCLNEANFGRWLTQKFREHPLFASGVSVCQSTRLVSDRVNSIRCCNSLRQRGGNFVLAQIDLVYGCVVVPCVWLRSRFGLMVAVPSRVNGRSRVLIPIYFTVNAV
jgi:hypothetical protein